MSKHKETIRKRAERAQKTHTQQLKWVPDVTKGTPKTAAFFMKEGDPVQAAKEVARGARALKSRVKAKAQHAVERKTRNARRVVKKAVRNYRKKK
jgi:hypothetical protein